MSIAWLGLVFALGALSPAAYGQDNCRDILRDGAFNFSSSSSRSQFSKNLVKHYCSSSSTSEGGDVGYSGVEVGYEAARRESVCKDYAKATSKLTERYETTLEASATLADTWLKCMEREGLHASAEISGTDPKQFFLQIRRQRGGTSNSDTISIRSPEKRGLKCEGIDLQNAESVELPGSLLYACSREDPFSTYIFAISSAEGSTVKAQVPGLPEPEPELDTSSPGIATFAITSRNKDHDGSCETLSIRVVAATGHAMTIPIRAPAQGKTASTSFTGLPLDKGLKHVEIRMQNRGACTSSKGDFNKMIVDKALLSWKPPNQESTTRLAYCGKNFRLDGDTSGGGVAILRPGTGGCFRANGDEATKDN